jgi:magnesium-transporting ATPase (P-type)
MKGADSEIIKRIHKHSGNKSHLDIATQYVNYFSLKGYRTLLVGVKTLDEKTYLDFENEIKEAGKDLKNKANKLEEIYDKLEQNIYLLGATIVEDKLQDQVPETIRDLRLAKIKVWMLTGDKFNTAKNIGLSCNLISNDMKLFQIKGEDGETLEMFNSAYEKDKEKLKINPKFGVIVDSIALKVILSGENTTKEFLTIAKDAESVICCRVSPLQKSEVVKAMKDFNKKCITLSIGDGGNDVSMINEAHIGIGIHGEEGMRAASKRLFNGRVQIPRKTAFFPRKDKLHESLGNGLIFLLQKFCIHDKSFLLRFFKFGFWTNYHRRLVYFTLQFNLYRISFRCEKYA